MNLRTCFAALFGCVALAAAATGQNLLVNPSFDTDLSGWELGNALFGPAWVADDANGSGHSGSIQASTPGGSPLAGVALAQCLPAASGVMYDFSTKVKLEQVEDVVADIRFIGGDDCVGTTLSANSVNASPSGPPGVWQTAHHTFLTPAGTQSALISLEPSTANGGAAQTIRWDDVYFGPAAPSSCAPGAQTLCLDQESGDRRFLVLSNFQTAQDGGSSGQGQAISLASLEVGRGGVFWFFDPTNPEMLVKVLDGCSLTGFYWVFVSAGTNVGVDLYVGDTRTGAVAFFHNPDLGPYPPIQNTFALACE